MRSERGRRAQAVVLAAGLVVWSATAGWPGRSHPLVKAASATAFAALTRARVGFRPPALNSGLRHGAVAAAVVAGGVAATSFHPRVRAAMVHRELPDRPLRWLAVEIPVGTVWTEEMAYRGALSTVAATAFGSRIGRLVQATAFGLSHIDDARAAGEPVIGTVLVTGVAGWVFGLLADGSGSLVAPMLAHLATNEAGAVAALAVQTRSGGQRAARRVCV